MSGSEWGKLKTSSLGTLCMFFLLKHTFSQKGQKICKKAVWEGKFSKNLNKSGGWKFALSPSPTKLRF